MVNLGENHPNLLSPSYQIECYFVLNQHFFYLDHLGPFICDRNVVSIHKIPSKVQLYCVYKNGTEKKSFRNKGQLWVLFTHKMVQNSTSNQLNWVENVRKGK